MTFSVGCNLPIVTAQNKNHFGTCLQFHSNFDGYLFVQVNKKSKELCFVFTKVCWHQNYQNNQKQS